MIDFHSHALPGVDDGSKSLDESLEMLKRSAEQGVTLVALTPHFYADRDTPERFLLRRTAALEKLNAAKTPGSPLLLAGAEVRYFPGLQHSEEISALRLEGTSCLLLEMPFTHWSARMAEDVLELNSDGKYTVVLAHIDRYLAMRNSGMIESFLRNGVRLQLNAESLLNWHGRRRVLGMIRRGEISFLGSDCHNLTARPPCIGSALEVIEEKLGRSAVKTLDLKSRAAMFAGGTAR